MNCTFQAVKFAKYHGLGNDFIIVDNRKGGYQLTGGQIKFMCSRRIGIGADGLLEILNPESESCPFRFRFCNSDGLESTLCGNGVRCILQFALHIGLIKLDKWVQFETIQGIFTGCVSKEAILVKFCEVKKENVIKKCDKTYFVDTGSPHIISLMDDNEVIDVVTKGREVRYSDEYKASGVNVNYVTFINDRTVSVRTYERGVEDETFACGTGAVAAAIVYCYTLCKRYDVGRIIDVQFKCGHLRVKLTDYKDHFGDIILEGPAQHVYDGVIHLEC